VGASDINNLNGILHACDTDLPDAILDRAGAFVGKDSRAIIRELEADGSRPAGVTGSHHHFKHPIKQGKVTVPHPRKDLHPKTVRSIYRQAGLREWR
jgi:predicted RNA binding protein YcfA (HicA-like mRNA interferase family)